MKSKHDKHWRRTFCDMKRGKFSRRAIRHFVRICALQSGRRLSERLPAASSSGAVAGASAVKTNFGAVAARSIEAWKREQTSGDEFVARLGKAFGAPRPGGEFVAFVHPTQEPDLRDLDRSLTKMHTWPMKVVLPDTKALLASLTPEACSG